MPITYKMDEARGILRMRASGHLVEREFADFFTAIGSDTSINATRAVFDMSDVEDLVMSASGIRELARRRVELPYVSPASKVAVVAPTDVHYGLARMYGQIAAEIGEIQVFRTAAEAEAWLEATE